MSSLSAGSDVGQRGCLILSKNNCLNVRNLYLSNSFDSEMTQGLAMVGVDI